MGKITVEKTVDVPLEQVEWFIKKNGEDKLISKRKLKNGLYRLKFQEIE